MRIAASVNLIRAINFFLGIIVKKQWNFFLRGIDRDIIKSSKKVYYEQYQLREDFAMVTADSEAPAAAAAAKAGRRLRGRGRA